MAPAASTKSASGRRKLSASMSIQDEVLEGTPGNLLGLRDTPIGVEALLHDATDAAVEAGSHTTFESVFDEALRGHVTRFMAEAIVDTRGDRALFDFSNPGHLADDGNSRVPNAIRYGLGSKCLSNDPPRNDGSVSTADAKRGCLDRGSSQ